MPAPRYRRRAAVRRRRLLAAAIAVLAIASAVAVVRALAPASSPPTTTSAPPTTSTSAPSTTTTTLPSPPFAVGTLSFTIVEPTTAGQAPRDLPTIVRYPATGSPGGPDVPGASPRAGPFPLVVFSQGFDISPEAYAGLLNAWAAAGYVVADPAYPYTSPGAPGGVIRTDIVHHPNDLRYVIATLLSDSARPGGILSDLIAPSRIGVIGQSDGGDVSLAAVANTCCRDAQIRAAVILSGAELSWFGGAYFTGPSVPLLVVQGTNDQVMNPVTCSVQLYNQAPEPKYYLSMIGQTHLSAYVPPGPARDEVARVTIDFLNAYLKHSPPALSAMTRAGDVAGLATITSAPSLAPVAGTCPDAPTG
ncbi:MAG: alpha/beta hydrolase family protein [Acidimicrobiales bacterium]